MAKLVLDTNRINDYWNFINERHSIWYRRNVLQQSHPWTKDWILDSFSFTNMYRILDPGTYYAVEKILNTDMPLEDKLWNLIMYRVIGRKDTHEMWGIHPMSEFDENDYRNFLETLAREGISQFSIAYLTTSFGNYKLDCEKYLPKESAPPKTTLAPRAFADWKKRLPGICDMIKIAQHPERVYEALMCLPSVGNFYAYQITVDLSYPLSKFGGKNALGLEEELYKDWTKAGPGAQAGICYLLGANGEITSSYTTLAKNNDIGIIKFLYKAQNEELQKRGFPWLREGFTSTSNGNGDIIPLSMADIQNTLCEYHKWHKVRRNEGKMRRKFVPPHQRI